VSAGEARRYILRPKGGGFAAVADPPLPDGTAEVEAESFEVARAKAPLWRLEQSGSIIDESRRR
jgi:hypothetical protein